MNRLRGIEPPPQRFRDRRDPRRRFPPSAIRLLALLQGGCCANPSCRAVLRHAQAHHIYAHSVGGPTNVENGILLCRTCHGMVHRGVVPLPLLVEWRQRQNGAMQATGEDILMQRIRQAPVVADLSMRGRLILLNQLLTASHSMPGDTVRFALLGQAMLAKVAVLTDTYYGLPEAPIELHRAGLHQARALLPMTSAAIHFGQVIADHAIVLRALHYRSMAYTRLGRLDQAQRTLASAAQFAISVQDDLKPGAFHSLSTPSRILRALGLARARCGGLASQAIREYHRGLRLAERFGTHGDWSEAQVRLVQLHDALGNAHERDRLLSNFLADGPILTPEYHRLAKRLWVEQLFANGRFEEAQFEATGLRLLAQQHKDRGLAARMVVLSDRIQHAITGVLPHE